MKSVSLNLKFGIYLLLIVIAYSCSSTKRVQSLKNVASMYNPSGSTIHPEFIVHHVSDSISNLFFNINPNELAYNKANPKSLKAAQIQIHYRIYGSFTEKAYFDSATVAFSLYQQENQGWFSSIIPLKIPAGSNYTIELSTTDLLRQSTNLTYLAVDKSQDEVSQNFLITDGDNKPVFNRFTSILDSVRVENRRTESSLYYIGFIKHYNDLPRPPFSLSRKKDELIDVDSIWTWEPGDKNFINITKEGIYVVGNDSTFSSSITIFSMSDFFPETKTPSSVLKPIQYLQTNREYKKLLALENKKLAVDSFWLDLSGNINRSKELIRVYYSRVYFSNKYFSSYKEGWRTDRGMIYTVFGPPSKIYISETSERWMYGENANLLSMDFYFRKDYHPLCSNNYVLSRQEVYKKSWYQAVDSWRNGRVYSVLK